MDMRLSLNRAATALRLGASTLLRSQTYLGAQYRRLRTKLGAPKAITAMAHRLARLVYRMLKYGQQYVDKGAEYYERRNRQQQIEFLRKKAARLGLQLSPAYPRGRSFWREHGPPLCGGCMSLKLLPRARSDRVAQLKSQAQHGSTAKAALTLERSCPMESMAPVLAIVKMVAGLS